MRCELCAPPRLQALKPLPLIDEAARISRRREDVDAWVCAHTGCGQYQIAKVKRLLLQCELPKKSQYGGRCKWKEMPGLLDLPPTR
jgi:hypothetical protein